MYLTLLLTPAFAGCSIFFFGRDFGDPGCKALAVVAAQLMTIESLVAVVDVILAANCLVTDLGR